MNAPVDVLAAMDAARHGRTRELDKARAAFIDLIEAASLVLAQAKEGKPMDLICLADCIDLAGGRDQRKAQRARVKGGAR